MPELPEVETVMRGMRTAFEGQKISQVVIRRPDLRWPFPDNLREVLEGQDVLSFRRRAKYILMRVSGGYTLLLHLGMSGRMKIGPIDQTATPLLHEHFVIETESGVRAGLVDPRRFGIVDVVPTDAEHKYRLLAHLGREPLDGTLSGAALREMFAGRRTPIKTALLDQRLIVGLGNIYVCEALFRTAIHPARPASDLTDAEYAALAEAIPLVLNEAIAAGGSSLRDYVQTDGSTGGFQDLHRVYGREGEVCPICGPSSGARIVRITQAGRSTFLCPCCQPATISKICTE